MTLSQVKAKAKRIYSTIIIYNRQNVFTVQATDEPGVTVTKLFPHSNLLPFHDNTVILCYKVTQPCNHGVYQQYITIVKVFDVKPIYNDLVHSLPFTSTLVKYLQVRLESTRVKPLAELKYNRRHLLLPLTSAEVIDSGKHSSLLKYSNNNSCKRFYNTAPWPNIIKLYATVIYECS